MNPEEIRQGLCDKWLARDVDPLRNGVERLFHTNYDQRELRKLFEYEIATNAIEPMVYLYNIKYMIWAGVSKNIILQGLRNLDTGGFSMNDVAAASRSIPINEFDFGSIYGKNIHLPGRTIVVLDVSGSAKYTHLRHIRDYPLVRMYAMLVEVMKVNNDIVVYMTAGSDKLKTGETWKIEPPHDIWHVLEELNRSTGLVGSGGMFLRDCYEYIESVEELPADRIIMFSGTQPDYPGDYLDEDEHICYEIPNKISHRYYNYFNAHEGVPELRSGYRGFDEAIIGWSPNILRFIMEYEEKVKVKVKVR